MDSYLKRGTRFERLMRLFNLLEPDRMVISISKVAVWATLAVSLVVFVVIAFKAPDQLISAGTAITALNGVVFGNYAYRRKQQGKGNVEPPVVGDQGR